jgi:hypothetical protein
MVREARSTDSSQIACLLGELGYPSSELFVRGRLGHLSLNAENPVFVAEYDNQIAGFLSFHIIPLFHLEGGLGRITALVVSARCRGCGLGKSLLQRPSASRGNTAVYESKSPAATIVQLPTPFMRRLVIGSTLVDSLNRVRDLELASLISLQMNAQKR